MAVYARIYGFLVCSISDILGHEEDYVSIGEGNYLAIGEYAMLEEILEKEL